MLRDAEPKSAEMHVGSDSLTSSQGPGDALAGELQGGSGSLITFGVHACGAKEKDFGLVGPVIPICRRVPKELFPMTSPRGVLQRVKLLNIDAVWLTRSVP